MDDLIRDTSCEEVFTRIFDEIETASKYLAIFIDEAELSLDGITDTLLSLEGGGSDEELKLLLVTSHRIKGSAASVGLNRAAKLAHLMEDLLQQLVDGGGLMTAELTDAMLKCTDGMRSYVEGLKQGTRRGDKFAQLASELSVAQAKAGTSINADEANYAEKEETVDCEPDGDGRPSPSEGTVSSEGTVPGKASINDELRRHVAEAAPADLPTVLGVVALRPGLLLSGMKAQLLYEKLLNLGDVCYLCPAADRLEELESVEEIRFGLATEKPTSLVKSCLKVAGVSEIAVEPLAGNESSPASAVAKPATMEAATVSPPGKTDTRVSSGPNSKSKISAAGGGVESGDRPVETLRVDIGRLDQLMNLAGQLVINKARFSRIGDRLRVIAGGNKSVRALGSASAALGKMTANRPIPRGEQALRRELEYFRNRTRVVQNELEVVHREVEAMASAQDSVTDLADTIHQLGRVSDGIQKSVMDTRMVPIGPLFNRFKRVVRDITRANGKNIRLHISGEKTELDKRMVDELGDPLIHMVRNSADHGIESPDAREAAGKPREGTISLSAFQRGNSIIVQVADDGKGLDIEGIAEKAVEKGIVSDADIRNMSTHRIAQLALEPGLTTAEKVTEVSGRGMGGDIVKSKIEELNGTIDLATSPGQGTTITVKLPLTLAILPSLMVDINGDVLAMPMESVVETIAIGRRAVTTMHGKKVADIRGRVVSLVNLDETFDWHNASGRDIAGGQAGGGESCPTEADKLTIVVVGEEGQELGLVVDRVIGKEDIVIKSMADNYRNVAGIAGASILGDGRVSLILDIVALIEMATENSNY